MDKFVEQAKQEVLYEQREGADDVRMMLERGDSNSRVNQEMSNIQLAYLGIVSCWKGNWKVNFEGALEGLERMYINLNGYSRVQAIEMRGQSSIAQREVLEKKERKGLLGLFSGK